MTLNKRIEQEIAEWEQKMGLKKVQVIQENVGLFDVDTRRLIILGGMLCEYDPELLRFQPKSSESENQVEFAPVAAFLALLFNEKELVDRLKKEVAGAFTKTNSNV